MYYVNSNNDIMSSAKKKTFERYVYYEESLMSNCIICIFLNSLIILVILQSIFLTGKKGE